SIQPGIQLYAAYPTATGYATMANFQAAHPTLEVGSLDVDPQFANIATGNLAPTNALLHTNGENLSAFVPYDINGLPRSATPTPGAFEMGQVSISGNDGGITALTAPGGSFCASQQQV